MTIMLSKISKNLASNLASNLNVLSVSLPVHSTHSASCRLQRFCDIIGTVQSSMSVLSKPTNMALALDFTSVLMCPAASLIKDITLDHLVQITSNSPCVYEPFFSCNFVQTLPVESLALAVRLRFEKVLKIISEMISGRHGTNCSYSYTGPQAWP